jgi:hypothetical protein
MTLSLMRRLPPIACSLSPGELRHRKTAWQALLKKSVARQRVAGGVRLTVETEVLPELVSLVELERQCCPWMRFTIAGDSLTITADGEGEQVVLAMLS